MVKNPKAISKPKKTDENRLLMSIDKLLLILNKSETGCIFWKLNDPDVHLMGIRPVKRTTLEIINENGFNPFEKKVNENLFKCFKILLVYNNVDNTLTQEESTKKKEVENNGIIYIKHHDPIYIYDIVRNSK